MTARDAVLHLAALPEGSAAEPPRKVAALIDLARRAGLHVEELKVTGDLAGTRVWRIHKEDMPRQAEVLLVHWYATGAGLGGSSDHLTVYAHNPQTGRRREVPTGVLRYTMANIAAGRMHQA